MVYCGSDQKIKYHENRVSREYTVRAEHDAAEGKRVENMISSVGI